jgi:hypothetical protein
MRWVPGPAEETGRIGLGRDREWWRDDRGRAVRTASARGRTDGQCGLTIVSCGIPLLDSRASVLGILLLCLSSVSHPGIAWTLADAFYHYLYHITDSLVVATLVSPLERERHRCFAVNPTAPGLLSTADRAGTANELKDRHSAPSGPCIHRRSSFLHEHGDCWSGRNT